VYSPARLPAQLASVPSAPRDAAPATEPPSELRALEPGPVSGVLLVPPSGAVDVIAREAVARPAVPRLPAYMLRYIGLGVLVIVAAIAERVSNTEDVFLDDFRIDVGVRPQRLENFLLGNDSVPALDQIMQQVECLRTERHAFLSSPQAVVDRVEAKGMERFHCMRTDGMPMLLRARRSQATLECP